MRTKGQHKEAAAAMDTVLDPGGLLARSRLWARFLARAIWPKMLSGLKRQVRSAVAAASSPTGADPETKPFRSSHETPGEDAPAEGALVWAKVVSWPWWPARVWRVHPAEGTTVLFLGSFDFAGGGNIRTKMLSKDQTPPFESIVTAGELHIKGLKNKHKKLVMAQFQAAIAEARREAEGQATGPSEYPSAEQAVGRSLRIFRNPLDKVGQQGTVIQYYEEDGTHDLAMESGEELLNARIPELIARWGAVEGPGEVVGPGAGLGGKGAEAPADEGAEGVGGCPAMDAAAFERLVSGAVAAAKEPKGPPVDRSFRVSENPVAPAPALAPAPAAGGGRESRKRERAAAPRNTAPPAPPAARAADGILRPAPPPKAAPPQEPRPRMDLGAENPGPSEPCPGPGAAALLRRVSVFWEDDNLWYRGVVLEVDPSKGKDGAAYRVLYDDSARMWEPAHLLCWHASDVMKPTSVDVVCGDGITGMFLPYSYHLLVADRPGQLLLPHEFEKYAGRGGSKHWKYSIRVPDPVQEWPGSSDDEDEGEGEQPTAHAPSPKARAAAPPPLPLPAPVVAGEGTVAQGLEAQGRALALLLAGGAAASDPAPSPSPAKEAGAEGGAEGMDGVEIKADPDSEGAANAVVGGGVKSEGAVGAAPTPVPASPGAAAASGGGGGIVARRPPKRKERAPPGMPLLLWLRGRGLWRKVDHPRNGVAVLDEGAVYAAPPAPRADRAPRPAASGAPRPSKIARRGDHGFFGIRQRLWGKWAAEIRDSKVQMKRVWLGTFDTPVEAAKCYDKAARALHGPNARVNFPDPPAAAAAAATAAPATPAPAPETGLAL